MSFHHARTLTDYARAAVDVRIRMADPHSGIHGLTYLGELFATRVPPTEREPGRQDPAARAENVLDAVARVSRVAWAGGESFVLAPAMTAIVAAAGDALDLTGDLLTADVAPCV